MLDSMLNYRYSDDDYYVQHFEFNKWLDKVRGPVTRFHTNFAVKTFDSSWIINDFKISESRPYPFTINRSEYQAVGKNDSTRRIYIIIEEFESVGMAHEALFNRLRSITNPNAPIQPPEKWNFGDIYKCGYWTRDNILVDIGDLSVASLPQDEMLNIHTAIDRQLTENLPEPKVARNSNLQIMEFAIEAKKIPLQAMTTIRLHVSYNNLDPSQLYYRFTFSGGRIIMKDNTYFYVAYEKGNHTITLVVTNGSGSRAEKKCTVKVVQ